MRVPLMVDLQQDGSARHDLYRAGRLREPLEGAAVAPGETPVVMLSAQEVLDLLALSRAAPQLRTLAEEYQQYLEREPRGEARHEDAPPNEKPPSSRLGGEEPSAPLCWTGPHLDKRGHCSKCGKQVARELWPVHAKEHEQAPTEPHATGPNDWTGPFADAVFGAVADAVRETEPPPGGVGFVHYHDALDGALGALALKLKRDEQGLRDVLAGALSGFLTVEGALSLADSLDLPAAVEEYLEPLLASWLESRAQRRSQREHPDQEKSP